ncbi:MAG: hypothetical protein FWB72_06630 [Firmicutes bacterium]|nr:hypothetical protein [Bacillota bacterium]
MKDKLTFSTELVLPTSGLKVCESATQYIEGGSATVVALVAAGGVVLSKKGQPLFSKAQPAIDRTIANFSRVIPTVQSRVQPIRVGLLARATEVKERSGGLLARATEIKENLDRQLRLTANPALQNFYQWALGM